MPVIPCQTLKLCRTMQAVVKYTKEKSVSLAKRYGVFMILSIEIISLILSKVLGANYVLFWFPFLTNVSILILMYLLLCNRRFLKYCQRTILGLKFLIAYFIFNIFVITTGLVNQHYTNIITYVLLGCAFIVLFITFFKFKE